MSKPLAPQLAAIALAALVTICLLGSIGQLADHQHAAARAAHQPMPAVARHGLSTPMGDEHS